MNSQKMTLPMPRSSRDDQRHHEDDEDHHHEEVGDQLLLRRPHDLAQLGDHLSVEQDRSGALGPPVDATGRRCLLPPAPPLPVSCADPVGRLVLPRVVRCCASSQGTRDLNPQPSVLETDALPVELVPSVGSRPATAGWGMAKHGERPPVAESTGTHRGRVQTGRRARPRRGARPGSAGPIQRPYDGPMTERPHQHPPRAPHLRPHRRASPSRRRSRSMPRPRRSRPRAGR